MSKKAKSIFIILLAIAGFCITYFFLLHRIKIDSRSILIIPGLSNLGAEDLFFNHHPKFLMWIFLISILISVSSGMFLPVIEKTYQLIKEFRISWTITVLNIILAVVIIGTVLYSMFYVDRFMIGGPEMLEEFNILLYCPQSVIRTIEIISFIVPLIGIIGFFMVNVAVKDMEHVIKSPSVDIDLEYHKQRFISLRKRLDYFLTVIGLIITGGIITTGALRLSFIEAVNIEYSSLFPIEFVYMYGGFFTLLLAIFYLPIYNQLKITGNILIKELKNTSNYKQDTGKQPEDLEESLKIKQSVQDRLKVILSILAPILGSILPKFFE